MKLRDLALPVVALLVFLADQFSKAWVIENIPINTTLDILPPIRQIFVLTHITNSGAAFGLFPQLSIVFTFVALAVSVVIVLYTRSIPAGEWLVRFSLGLQLGGAIGNLVDRLRYGSVVDLFYVRYTPVFNVADLAIVSGVGLLMFHLMRTPPNGSAAQTAMASSDSPENRESSGNGLG
jgi:signal peptidase II